MDIVVVTHATVSAAQGKSSMAVYATAVGALRLARMEIGGLRFALPLAEIAAIVEPTAMETLVDESDRYWIGQIRSRQESIAVASGSALLNGVDRDIRPGRIVVLRGTIPVGLAVDRMLSARTVEGEALLQLPGCIPALLGCPVAATFWGEDDQLEILLDWQMLREELDGHVNSKSEAAHNTRAALRARYGTVDYQRGLEIGFEGSAVRWALPMSAVRLVTDARAPHPLPRATDKVAGIVSWQQNPIPVIDPTSSVEGHRTSLGTAKFVVIGAPVNNDQNSTGADAVVIVDRIAGIHNNLRIEHGHGWDEDGAALSLLQITELLA